MNGLSNGINKSTDGHQKHKHKDKDKHHDRHKHKDKDRDKERHLSSKVFDNTDVPFDAENTLAVGQTKAVPTRVLIGVLGLISKVAIFGLARILCGGC